MAPSPEPAHPSVEAFAAPPDPGPTRTVDVLVERLRLLKVWAGNPSYEAITGRIAAAWAAAGRPVSDLPGKTTVVDCFRPGRQRLNPDLVVAVVQALHPDVGYVAQWRQALRVIGGETTAAAQVRVQDRLPPDLVGFIGRTSELTRLRQALQHGQRAGGAVAISAIAGMAGIGKTELAVHAGHLLADEKRFDRVLFVDLRGFHPDPAQPPADPAAVLDGFLRLLDVPGQQIPHDLPSRVALYRKRLVGQRTLVLLDNVAAADQVRPLLPDTPGCLALITSRRSLTDLAGATHLAVDVFTPEEALQYLTRAAPGIPVGPDARAAARIARLCGHLPLALAVVVGHMLSTSGWTLTDHADRLDERHRAKRLDTGVELALDLSYRHLPTAQQRLLRLAALHPGQDLDAHAAAALADTDLSTARTHLLRLSRDYLLQQASAGRFAMHDLVRVYAAGRSSDVDTPADRRAALTRLFDYYLATAAAAMDASHPAETHHRPRIPPSLTPGPDLTNPDAARAWLDTERPTLVASAAHTAAHGWFTHTTGLSSTLFRYLIGEHPSDALTVHGHALHAAHRIGDPAIQANVLTHLGAAHGQLGRYGSAAEHFNEALALFEQVGDPVGQGRALGNLGVIESRLGHYQAALDHYEQDLALTQRAGDRDGEARCLCSLALVKQRLGHYLQATDHLQQALTLFRQVGDRGGEARALLTLGEAEELLGRVQSARNHLQQSLAMFQQVGDRDGEAWALDSLGTLHLRHDKPTRAIEFHQQALAIFRASGERGGEAWALNGLGEAAHAAGVPADALTHHTAAQTIATDIGARDQQARAHTGLGHAHQALNDPIRARQHYQHALTLYTDLGTPEADQIRAHLRRSRTSPSTGRLRP